ncbi:MAG: phosphatidate cytidylyltransferase [Candidatus Zixiibacteriota bacterium]
MSRNLVLRIAVAAATIPIILWISYRGGVWLWGMVTLLAVVALAEYLVAEGFRPSGLSFWLAELVVIGALWQVWSVSTDVRLSADLLADGPMNAATSLFLLLGGFFVLTSLMHAVGKRPANELFVRHCRLFWGVSYIAFLYPFVFWCGQGFRDVSGGDSLLLLFGLLWIGDTAAMGIGKWLGSHRLAPSVSPNKTVEGFIGGIVGAVAVGLFVYVWRLESSQFFTLSDAVLLSVGCSVFGQLGDLVESMWKRSVGIKDSSAIIPGHGGVLDRFDSLLFAAPFMYFYFWLCV